MLLVALLVISTFTGDIVADAPGGADTVLSGVEPVGMPVPPGDVVPAGPCQFAVILGEGLFIVDLRDAVVYQIDPLPASRPVSVVAGGTDDRVAVCYIDDLGRLIGGTFLPGAGGIVPVEPFHTVANEATAAAVHMDVGGVWMFWTSGTALHRQGPTGHDRIDLDLTGRRIVSLDAGDAIVTTPNRSVRVSFADRTARPFDGTGPVAAMDGGTVTSPSGTSVLRINGSTVDLDLRFAGNSTITGLWPARGRLYVLQRDLMGREYLSVLDDGVMARAMPLGVGHRILCGDAPYLVGDTVLTLRDDDGDVMPDIMERPYGDLQPEGDLDGDGLTDREELCHPDVGGIWLDPGDPDTDDDGLMDGDEMEAGSDPNDPDTDDDQLTDDLEVLLGANPLDPDTDDDGLYDGYEHVVGLSPVSADTDGDGTADGDEDLDGDGLTAIAEQALGTSPLSSDTDGDSMPDGWEAVNGLDPCRDDAREDPDGDGLVNRDEWDYPGIDVDGTDRTDPQDPDTDGDRLMDGEELDSGCDPTAIDTDGDGMPDGWERWMGLDPTEDDAADDPDGDALDNVDEYRYGMPPGMTRPYWGGTDPMMSDTDLDGILDGDEDADLDGDPADIGVSETDARCGDTDGDGLLDGRDYRGIGEDVDLDGHEAGETDPLDDDTDDDGLTDGEEMAISRRFRDAIDMDGDGAPLALDADSDGDGIDDGVEGIDDVDGDGRPSMIDWDSDGDSLPDRAEMRMGTDPTDRDSDGDGMPDGWEVENGLDPASDDADMDADGDGVDLDMPHDGIQADERFTNLMEYLNGTRPRDRDTDGDGIPDGWEVRYGLDPLRASDARLGGLTDGDDRWDDDGLTNLAEYQAGTDPLSNDTDGDGIDDLEEVLVLPLTDPTSPEEGSGDQTSSYIVGYASVPECLGDGLVVLEHLPSWGIVRVAGPEGRIETLRKEPGVTFVEGERTIDGIDTGAGWSDVREDGGRVGGRPACTPLQAMGVRRDPRRGAGVTVAVLDTGVGDHREIEVAEAASFVDEGVADLNGHGTHVAGIIGSGEGIAPGATILSAKVLDANGRGTTSSVVRGILWAVDAGADIITMSFGSDTPSRAVEHALRRAAEAGVLLIAASGSDGDDRPDQDVDHPATSPLVIAVGAVDLENRRPHWSSDGGAVEVCAPGVDILSAAPDDGWRVMSGASMAAPMVAGLAAACMGAYADASADDVRSALAATAIDLGAPGRDPEYGFGRVTPRLLDRHPGGYGPLSRVDAPVGPAGGPIRFGTSSVGEIRWGLRTFLVEANRTALGGDGEYLIFEYTVGTGDNLDRIGDGGLDIEGYSLSILLRDDEGDVQIEDFDGRNLKFTTVDRFAYLIRDGITDNGIDVSWTRYHPHSSEPLALAILASDPTIIGYAPAPAGDFDHSGYVAIRTYDLPEDSRLFPYLSNDDWGDANGTVHNESLPSEPNFSYRNWTVEHPTHWLAYVDGDDPDGNTTTRTWTCIMGSGASGLDTFSVLRDVRRTADYLIPFWDNGSSDGDDLPDAFEISLAFVNESVPDPSRWDTDGDGIPDGDEYRNGTDLASVDTDGDGLWDGDRTVERSEVAMAFPDGIVRKGVRTVRLPGERDLAGDVVIEWTFPDVTDLGPDADTGPLMGAIDGGRIVFSWMNGTATLNVTLSSGITGSCDPTDPDTDDDGVSDRDEVFGWFIRSDRHVWRNSDPQIYDTDGDGLPDLIERERRSDPFHADTDGDGLSDREEVRIWGTDPCLKDPDGDGLTDLVDPEPGIESVPPRIVGVGRIVTGNGALGFQAGLRIVVNETSPYTITVSTSLGGRPVGSFNLSRTRAHGRSRLIGTGVGGDVYSIFFPQVMVEVDKPSCGAPYDDPGPHLVPMGIDGFTVRIADVHGNVATYEGSIVSTHDSIIKEMGILGGSRWAWCCMPLECVFGGAAATSTVSASAIVVPSLAATAMTVIFLADAEVCLMALTMSSEMHLADRDLVMSVPLPIEDVDSLPDRVDLPGWLSGMGRASVDLTEGFLATRIVDGTRYVRGFGYAYVCEVIETFIGPLSGLEDAVRRTVKYLVEHGEIWLDLDGSEPEWGVIVVNVTSGTLARILDVPEAKVRAVVGDGIFIVTYLTERLRVARTYFTVRDPAGDLVGPGCPFELRLYPPPVIGGE